MSAGRLQRAAQRDAQRLLRVVEHFGFATERDRAAWLAALLTVVAGAACMPAPIFVVTADVPHTGKSLLIDVLAIIATGHAAPRMRHSPGEADQRRQISNVAMQKLPLVLLDNIKLPLGSMALDSALARRTWRVQLAGKRERTEVPLLTPWFVSGLNVKFRRGADTPHRAVMIRLRERRLEGERDHAMRESVRAGQAALHEAAARILDAWDQAATAAPVQRALAERYAVAVAPLGDYEGWSVRIHALIRWLGFPDPIGAPEDMTPKSGPSYLELG